MNKEPNPYKQATMSTRLLNMQDRRHHKVRKALDSTEADRRSALRPGSVKLEQQAIGIEFTKQVTGTHFENPRDTQYVCTHLGYAALFSGLHTSASNTSEVMNRVIDIPEVAADEWTQTPSGLFIQTGSILDSATKGAHELSFRHQEHADAARRTRRIGRSFGSSAAFLFNLGRPIPTGTPFEAQFTVRERVMDAGFEARQQVEETGTYWSLSAMADPDSAPAAWFRRNAPSQAVYSAIDQAYDELKAA